MSLLLTRSFVDHQQRCIHFATSFGFDKNTCVTLQPLITSSEQIVTPQRCVVIFSQFQNIQGVWEKRRYQQPHTKIPSAKESALFSDVVRVSYGIASSPHKIILDRIIDKLHCPATIDHSFSWSILGRGDLDNCGGRYQNHILA